MKTLYLIRHAKSSWKFPELNDNDRPLSKRGKRDAPYMAKLLKSYDVKPDLIITSTAKRALTTAKAFAEEFGYKKGEIKATEELYHADENDMLEIIKNADDSCSTILMFGHNPELTYFANSICDYNIDNVPTCGVLCIDFNTDSWSEVDFGKGKFISLEYPKKYFK